MPNSRLPQWLDIRSEHGVQIEHDSTRNVTYLHVDGYTAVRVAGAPQTTLVTDGDEQPIRKYADREMVMRLCMAIILQARGSKNPDDLDGPEARQLRDSIEAALLTL